MQLLHHAYLLLGGNLGDRHEHLARGMVQINSLAGKISRQSSFYETEPWGVTDQPHYLNAAILIETGLSPSNLFWVLKTIEAGEGRTDPKKYTSRTLDIDILFYDDIVLNSDTLTIPHPRLHLRKFALVPLNEIAGEVIHPLFQKPIGQLLNDCNDPLDVWKFGDQFQKKFRKTF